MRELFNVILLLLNMHGMVQRERLVRLYSSRGGGVGGFGKRRMANNGSNYNWIIDPDTILFVLATVVRKFHDCWVAKVDDNKEYAVPNFQRWWCSTPYIG